MTAKAITEHLFSIMGSAGACRILEGVINNLHCYHEVAETFFFLLEEHPQEREIARFSLEKFFELSDLICYSEDCLEADSSSLVLDEILKELWRSGEFGRSWLREIYPMAIEHFDNGSKEDRLELILSFLSHSKFSESMKEFGFSDKVLIDWGVNDFSRDFFDRLPLKNPALEKIVWQYASDLSERN